jgi:hypothetical protein
MSRLMDDLAFGPDMYPDRWGNTFAVAGIYRKKADKVSPMDPNGTDGSKPGGTLDWVERSRARDIVSSEGGRYSEWLIPKFRIFLEGRDLQKSERMACS